MVTEDDVRRVALSLPATVEKSYNRLPSFRVGSNLLIRIHELPDVLFVRCANLEERDELLKAEPEKFFITPHYDGYPAVLVRLGQAGFDEVAELVTEAWRICAPKRLLAAYDAKHRRHHDGEPAALPPVRPTNSPRANRGMSGWWLEASWPGPSRHKRAS